MQILDIYFIQTASSSGYSNNQKLMKAPEPINLGLLNT